MEGSEGGTTVGSVYRKQKFMLSVSTVMFQKA